MVFWSRFWSSIAVVALLVLVGSPTKMDAFIAHRESKDQKGNRKRRKRIKILFSLFFILFFDFVLNK
jgi:hypothetical protein